MIVTPRRPGIGGDNCHPDLAIASALHSAQSQPKQNRRATDQKQGCLRRSWPR
jgi:hypothetical protein